MGGLRARAERHEVGAGRAEGHDDSRPGPLASNASKRARAAVRQGSGREGWSSEAKASTAKMRAICTRISTAARGTRLSGGLRVSTYQAALEVAFRHDDAGERLDLDVEDVDAAVEAGRPGIRHGPPECSVYLIIAEEQSIPLGEARLCFVHRNQHGRENLTLRAAAGGGNIGAIKITRCMLAERDVSDSDC